MAKRYTTKESSAAHAAKALLANIRFAGVDEPIRSVVVASADSGEGKSTICLELARAMATSGRRTLLVDCDMRRRALAGMLSVHGEVGIYSVIAGMAELERALMPTSVMGLQFMDCEPFVPNPSGILMSSAFERLMGRLDQAFDYIVFDTPPVCLFADASVIAATADATLLVAREGVTQRERLVEAYEQLKRSGARVIGTVMNGCHINDSLYAYESSKAKGAKK